MPRTVVGGWRGWTSKPIVDATYGDGAIAVSLLNGDSVNKDTHKGFLESAGGYRRVRRIATNLQDKAGASFLHKDLDGDEYPIYECDGALYRETGSGVVQIVSGLTSVYVPGWVMFQSAGVSIRLNGTNSEAQLIRIIGGNPVAVAYDFNPPGGSFSTGTSAGGGSLSDGTYNVRIVALDDAGVTTVISGPTATSSVAVSNGGSSQKITLDLTSTTYDSRTVKFRVYFTAAGAGDTTTAYFQVGSDTVIATTTFDITAVSTTNQIANRNGIYRTAVMPLANARMATIYEGRIIIAALDTDIVYWSQRTAPNHWFTTNGSDQTEGQWQGAVTGLASAEDGVYVFTANSIHRLTGKFAFDANNAAFPHDVRPELVSPDLGCIAHGSIIPVSEMGVAFLSSRGPALASQGVADYLLPDDIEHFYKCLDFTFVTRWTGAHDVTNGLLCWAVTRKTNSTRPHDGTATAGICDRIIRFNITGGVYEVPLAMEVVHLSSRQNPGTVGTQTNRQLLMSVSAHGTVNEHNWSHAHGPGGDVITSADVTGTKYNGFTSTATSTTSVAITLGDFASSDLIGYGLMLRYSSNSGVFPSEEFNVVVKSNTLSAGTLTLNWSGARTAPTGSGTWTVRIAAPMQIEDSAMRLLPSPIERTSLKRVIVSLNDEIGAKSV